MKQAQKKQYVVSLSAEVHRMLRIRAAERNMRLQDLADLVLHRVLVKMGMKAA